MCLSALFVPPASSTGKGVPAATVPPGVGRLHGGRRYKKRQDYKRKTLSVKSLGWHHPHGGTREGTPVGVAHQSPTMGGPYELPEERKNSSAF